MNYQTTLSSRIIRVRGLNRELGVDIYAGLRELLRKGGVVLIADEINDEQKKEQHLLSIAEHETELKAAGFSQFRTLLVAGDLTLFMARIA